MKLDNPYVDWLIARGKERTTWLGVIAIASSFGITIAPEMTEHVVSVGLALTGLVAIWIKDKKAEDAK